MSEDQEDKYKESYKVVINDSEKYQLETIGNLKISLFSQKSWNKFKSIEKDVQKIKVSNSFLHAKEEFTTSSKVWNEIKKFDELEKDFIIYCFWLMENLVHIDNLILNEKLNDSKNLIKARNTDSFIKKNISDPSHKSNVINGNNLSIKLFYELIKNHQAAVGRKNSTEVSIYKRAAINLHSCLIHLKGKTSYAVLADTMSSLFSYTDIEFTSQKVKHYVKPTV